MVCKVVYLVVLFVRFFLCEVNVYCFDVERVWFFLFLDLCLKYRMFVLENFSEFEGSF